MNTPLSGRFSFLPTFLPTSLFSVIHVKSTELGALFDRGEGLPST